MNRAEDIAAVIAVAAASDAYEQAVVMFLCRNLVDEEPAAGAM